MGRGKDTIGKGFAMPRIVGQYTTGRGFKIPWGWNSRYHGYGVRYTMNMWVKIPM